jgi:hypothetical protein
MRKLTLQNLINSHARAHFMLLGMSIIDVALGMSKSRDFLLVIII